MHCIAMNYELDAIWQLHMHCIAMNYELDAIWQLHMHCIAMNYKLDAIWQLHMHCIANLVPYGSCVCTVLIARACCYIVSRDPVVTRD